MSRASPTRTFTRHRRYYCRERALEYDFIVVGAGADAHAIALTFDGARANRTMQAATLSSTSVTTRAVFRPIAYQDGASGRSRWRAAT